MVIIGCKQIQDKDQFTLPSSLFSFEGPVVCL